MPPAGEDAESNTATESIVTRAPRAGDLFLANLATGRRSQLQTRDTRNPDLRGEVAWPGRSATRCALSCAWAQTLVDGPIEAEVVRLRHPADARERARSSGTSPPRHTHSRSSRTAPRGARRTRSRQRSLSLGNPRLRLASRGRAGRSHSRRDRHRSDARFDDLRWRRASPVVRSLPPSRSRHDRRDRTSAPPRFR
jgi:hypothetical protein